MRREIKMKEPIVVEKPIFNRKPFSEIKISVFESVRSKTVLKDVLFTEWIQPDPELSQVVQTVRDAETKEEKTRIKCTLPAATISALCVGGHARENIVEPTGLLAIDIDGNDNTEIQDVEQLRDELSRFTNIAYIGKSVGGKGLYCVIPIEDPYSHKAHFNALKDVFDQLGVTIDSACSDPTRLRIYSIDDNAYINENAVIFTRMLPDKQTVTKSTSKPSSSKKNVLTTEKQTPEKHRKYDNSPIANRRKVESTIKKIVDRKLDITGDYSQWFMIGCAIAKEFGADGLEMFRAVSQFSPLFSEVKLKNNYMKYVEKNGYSYSIGTFFYYANLYLYPKEKKE